MITLGNISLLEARSVGFMCSRITSSMAILQCFEWATEIARDENACVMSSFHSPIEDGVLGFLTRGKCKIIYVLGRKMYRDIPEKLRDAYEQGRVLIVSVDDAPMINRQRANKCHEYIAEKAKSLMFGFISEGSQLQQIYDKAIEAGKNCTLIAKIETHKPERYDRT